MRRSSTMKSYKPKNWIVIGSIVTLSAAVALVATAAEEVGGKVE